MKEVIRLWKKREFYSVYTILEEKGYEYTIDKFEKDFSKVSSADKYCYLIYLLAKDYSVNNTLLLCEFLLYTDTFFFDIHSVIQMFIRRALELFPMDGILLEWIVLTYENHPDSPFDKAEILAFKKQLSLVD